MFPAPVRFIEDVIHNDRSLLGLLYANHTFVNPVLAKHSGMPEVVGGADKCVRVDDARRYGSGGLPAMAVFLTRSPAADEPTAQRLKLQTQSDIDFAGCRQSVQNASHGRDGPNGAQRPNIRPRHRKVGMIEGIHHNEAKLESRLLMQVEVLH